MIEGFSGPEVVAGCWLQPRVPELPPSPIFLPTVDDRPVYLDERRLHQNILLVGGIGEGKTSAMCHILSGVRRIMTHRDIGLIFDTKGDYLRSFGRPGDVVVRPRGAGPDEDAWNLLEEVRASSEEREAVLSEIGHTLFDEMEERSSQPFFPIAARGIFQALLRRQAAREGTTNASLDAYWSGCGAEQLRADLAADERSRSLLWYISQDGPQTQGVLAHVTELMQDVFVGRFREPGDLSVRRALRQKGGRLVFIEYDVATGRAQAPVYRILVDLAIKEALGREHPEGRVFFFIDEFSLLPKLQHLANGLAFGREPGLAFVVSMQSHAQVRAAYGDEAEPILAGFSTVIAFRVTDPPTRAFIQGIAGRNVRRFYVPSPAAGPPLHQLVEGWVVEDHHIWSLRVGQAIVFTQLSPEGPFCAQLQPYAPPGEARGA